MQLYNDDCLYIMKQIPEKSVDMVLCDLPFGATNCKWDICIPFEPLWAEYHRVCKQNAAIVLHCQGIFTHKLIMSNPKEFRYCWVWYKHYARNFLNARKMPLRVHEDIAVFYKKQCTYNPQMTKGALRSKGNSCKSRGCYGDYKPVKVKNDVYYPKTILDFAGVPINELQHPTQKSVALLEYLIKTYTNAGEIVLDNCMGVGSTGVACANTGRYFIGIEQDREYFSIAQNRINASVNQQQNAGANPAAGSQ